MESALRVHLCSLINADEAFDPLKDIERFLFLPFRGLPSRIIRMSRRTRAEYPGGIHHAMSRGDPREEFLLCDVDRRD